MGLTMATNFLIFALPALLAGLFAYFISSKEIT